GSPAGAGPGGSGRDGPDGAAGVLGPLGGGVAQSVTVVGSGLPSGPRAALDGAAGPDGFPDGFAEVVATPGFADGPAGEETAA
ncbi:hypothetical protein PJM50_30375, partial [Mycobacterium kansasii]